MPDRDKVIKGTEDGIAFAESRGFGGLANTMRDALSLLKEKEQEPLLAHWLDDAGHWIEGDGNKWGEMIDTFRCSWCGYYMYWKTPFCPNCGAKMQEDGEVNG